MLRLPFVVCRWKRVAAAHLGMEGAESTISQACWEADVLLLGHFHVDIP